MAPAEMQARIEELELALERSLRLVEAKDARIAELEAQVAQLVEQVATLTTLLNRNSRNSHLPPSTDPPGSKKPGKNEQKKRKGGGSKRKRGGQKGHKGAHRELVPESQVSKFVDLYPEQCEHCCSNLPRTPDLAAHRHQAFELPPIQPIVTEYRRHCVDCPDCGRSTLAPYDPKIIPKMPFGPRLLAVVGTLTGAYHLSRRSAKRLIFDLLGLELALGTISAIEARVSDALEPAVDEAWAAVERDSVKHTDGTTWLQSGCLMALWTIATASATVYRVLRDGTKKTLIPLYGELRGILVSDRASSLTFWAMESRQICWAHLIRRFVSFSERDGPEGKLGRQFLEFTGLTFDYWEQFKSGELTREQLCARMEPVRERFEALLEHAVSLDIRGFSGSCQNMLEHRLALWTFVELDGVDPTNDHAERELRAFVLWRRRSFGSQSERGNVFAERIMTVVHTARKQGVDVLEFVTACCRAKLRGGHPPALVTAAKK